MLGFTFLPAHRCRASEFALQGLLGKSDRIHTVGSDFADTGKTGMMPPG